jgi:amino acid adenylation domain-containing protein/non-ribosomal peptide synthase protein (TIGR01720 family)
LESFKTASHKNLNDDKIRTNGNMDRTKKLDKKNIEDILVLTPMQEGILFHYLEDPGSENYFEQLSLDISGKIDVRLFEKAWNFLVETNEMLRTVYRWKKVENPVQIILKDYEVKPVYHGFSSRESRQNKQWMEEIKAKDREEKFDLQEVPFRITLCKIREDKYRMIISNHHILYDGWSNGIILKEFFGAYCDLFAGKELVRPVKTKFIEFIKYIKNQDESRQEKFWMDYLKSFGTWTEIPIKKAKGSGSKTGRGGFGNYPTGLSGETKDQLEGFVKSHKVTFASLLYSVWGILLQKYTNRDDVLFGVTVSGRSAKVKGIEDMVGLFINTLPMRIERNPDETILGLINRIKDIMQVWGEFECTSLAKIKEYSQSEGKGDLFDSILAIENYPLDNEEFKADGPLKIDLHSMVEVTHYDLTIRIQVANDIEINFIYHNELFDKTFIQQLARHFTYIMKDILKIPGKRLHQIEILSIEEKKRILADFNHIDADYPRDKTIHQLFEEQVEKTPENIAAARERCNATLTYRLLNQKSNQLARMLRENRVGPETIVGLMVEPSIEMICGIMSILKAGGAYLPIDPGYPAERIKYMIDDSGMNILLTTSDLKNSTKVKSKKIYMDRQELFQGNTTNLENTNQPWNLAYIIYTSGTTGKPKGTLIEHKDVVRLMINNKFQFDFSETDVWTMFHSFCFDFSVWEMYGAILYGGKLIIIPKMVARDTGRFLEFLKEERVTILNQTPSAFYNLMEREFDPSARTSNEQTLNIRYIIFGGEALAPAKLKRWKDKYPQTRLINMYGITETTVHVTFKEITDQDIALNISNIGKPIPTLWTCVTDKDMKLQPVGVPGELCVGGEGVGRGYLNRPELTNEKFIKCMESPCEPDGRFYRSGDLAKVTESGEMEYLGRIDSQVKIRGYRIELGEIENVLLEHTEIKEAVVIVREVTGKSPASAETGDNHLFAYVVFHSLSASLDGSLRISRLRRHLSEKLPAYMIPSYFTILDRLPLTSNGKLDRKALPDAEVISEKVYTRPRNEREKELVKIWSDILRIDSGKIGIDDNFFELGGHSLKATALTNRMHKTFDIEIPLTQLFQSPTIRGLSLYLSKAEESLHSSIDPAEKNEYYVVSPAQKRLYTLQYMNKDGTGYNMSSAVVIEGDVDRDRLEETFKKLITRHESLRTSFAMEKEQPVQKIHENVEFDIEYHDAEHMNLPDGVPSMLLNPSHLPFISQFVRPFDLSRAPLLRVGLVKVKEEKYLLMVDMHHIVSDGISIQIFLKEFAAIFSGKNLPTVELQYKDYSQWQHLKQERDPLKKQRDYWRKQFEDEIPLLDLPVDFARPMVQSFEGKHITAEISAEQSRALKTLAREEGVSLFIVLLAAANFFLSRLSNREDIVVGTPVAGRDHVDLESIIGMFVNTLVLRNRVPGTKSVRDFLREVGENTLEAFENRDYPFEKLVELLETERDIGHNPLFGVMFLLQDVDISRGIKIEAPSFARSSGLTLKPFLFETGTSKFDLTLEMVETDENLLFTFEYCTKLFKKATIERFIRYFKKTISSIVGKSKGKLLEIEIISEEEKREILFTFNNTRIGYPVDKTIHRVFEEQVEKTPNHIAVIGQSVQRPGYSQEAERCALSYRQLNKKSNQLAGILREKGIKPNKPAAIIVDRSIEMIIGIMAILKAGGAYLPIDPDYPNQRIKYMLNDSSGSMLLTTRELENKMDFKNKPIFLEEAASYRSSTINPGNISLPAHLAYIIYTSGTTGRPKGSMIEHKNVVRLMVNDEFQFDFSDTDVWTMFHSFCFDFSVWEMYGALLYGGKLIVIPKMTARVPEKYLKILKKQLVTVLNQTPVAFYNLANEELKYSERHLKLRYIIFGGEVLNPAKLKKWNQKYPGTKLINMFGITETTVHVTYKEVTSKEIASNISNIGKPIPTLSACIMDNHLRLLPQGVAGEFCVGGEGIGRGYLNRVELTKEKFADYPFKVGERIYKSGDLARILNNGDLEYLGRIDRQVKIRGFRVELGEIENQLLDNDGIKEALVMERTSETGGKYLCAYVVPRSIDSSPSKNPLKLSQLRDHLARRLPDYMVPAYFVPLKNLPLTPNGKINRSALPPPAGIDLGSDTEYAAPRNAIERKLVEIWKHVLGKNIIGINDNYFDLGGDSITTIQIASRMNREGYKLEMRDIFYNPRISDLAPLIKKIEQIADQSVITGTVPLTPIQKWFFENITMDNHHFNQSVIIYTEKGFEEEALKTVFTKLQEHHDALRMNYKKINGEIIQTLNGLDYPFSLEVHDFKNRRNAVKLLEQKADRIQASIDLERGPLMKLGLFHLDDGDRLLIVIHHLVTDGVSWRILIEDFQSLYRQYENREPFSLPLKTDSFKVWAERLSEYADSRSFLKEKSYWEKLVSAEIPGIRRDFEEEEDNYEKDADRFSFVLGEEETNMLLTKVNETFNTEINDILLTALGLAIKQTFKNDRFLIAVEGHGREEIIKDIEIRRTIGWFTSIYPVLFDFSNVFGDNCKNNVYRHIKDVKEVLRRVPNKGIGYGILKYLTAKEHREGIDFKQHPRVIFNYLGQFDMDLTQLSFRMTRESVGNTRSSNGQRPYELDVSGIIINKQLEISTSYSRKQYKSETVEILSKHFKSELNRIISYCSTMKGKELTPGDLTYSYLSIENLERLQKQYLIEDIYTCTPVQEGMLFHSLYASSSSAYFVQVSYRLHGELDVAIVEKSLNELLKRYDILRTAFVYEGLDRPVQVVLKERRIDFFYKDIRQLNGRDGFEKEIFIKEFKTKDRQRPFNLAKDVLMRVAVIQVDNVEYQFIWSFHHILMDGWCTGILSAEFFEIYKNFSENKPHRLPAAIPYRNYIQWLEKQDKGKAKKYWQNLLKGYKEAATIPRKKTSGADHEEYKREEFSFIVEPEKTGALEKLAAKKQVTLNVVLQTIWGIMLAKYNNKQDVVFGIVVSGRPTEIDGVESMVGLFINTIPVRVKSEKDTTFSALLREIQEQSINSGPHDHYPLVEIQAQCYLKQDLMDHFLTFLKFPVVEQIEGAVNVSNSNKRESHFEILNIDSIERSNYNLDVLINSDKQLKIKLRFNTNIYDSTFMKKLPIHIEEVIDQVIENNDIKVKDILISHDRLAANPNLPIDDDGDFKL